MLVVVDYEDNDDNNFENEDVNYRNEVLDSNRIEIFLFFKYL